MEYDVPRALGVPDYVVVGAMLLCSISIGFYQAHKGKKERQGTEGYLLGNRSMSFVAVAISLGVNFKSAVTVIGIPADVYQFGIIYGWTILAVLLSGQIVSYVFLPVLYNLKIHSAYEYLERRYGRPMRMVATAGFLMQTLLYMGVNVYGPALALARVTGFPQITAMLTTGFVCITYSTMGGLRGIVWSDVFQAAVMFTAMISFLIRGTAVAGGVGEVWNRMVLGGRRNAARFDLDPRIRYTFGSAFVGCSIYWIANLGTNQTNVQRFISVNSIKKARWAMFIGTLGIATFTGMAVACGVVLYSLFHSCDPIKIGCIRIRDELMPYAVMDVFRSFPGMRGLFLAGVFSASLSTVSSGLNAMVSVIIADFVKPYTKWNDSRYELFSRVLTACLGLTIIGTGFLISVLGDILSIAKSVVGSFGGAYLGVFLMGIWMPFVNSWGAGAGFFSGVLGSFLAFLGSKGFTKPLYLTRKLPVSTSFCPAGCGYLDSMNATTSNLTVSELLTSTTQSYYSTAAEPELSFVQSYCSISYYYMSALGLSYTIFVGTVVSLMSGGWKRRHDVDPSTVDSISINRMCKWLPRRLRCANGEDERKKSDGHFGDSKTDEMMQPLKT